MSTMEATGAADVLADLDELDSVMGVETQDQQDLKPKQVQLIVFLMKAWVTRIRLHLRCVHQLVPWCYLCTCTKSYISYGSRMPVG